MNDIPTYGNFSKQSIFEASVECVGRKIRYGQHLPERGASPSWLPASTVAQGCQGRRRRGKAGALTGLWHGAIFSPFLCTTPNAWKPLLWLIFSKSATHTFYRRALFLIVINWLLRKGCSRSISLATTRSPSRIFVTSEVETGIFKIFGWFDKFRIQQHTVFILFMSTFILPAFYIISLKSKFLIERPF